MFDSRMTLSNQVKDEMTKFFGPKMFQSIIPRNIRLAEAPDSAKAFSSMTPSPKVPKPTWPSPGSSCPGAGCPCHPQQ